MRAVAADGRGVSIRRFRLQLPVSKPYVVKLDTATAFSLYRMSWRDDIYGSIQKFEDAFAGSHGVLKDVVFVAEVLNWAEEALRVQHEGHHDADGDCAAYDADAPKPENESDSDG